MNVLAMGIAIEDVSFGSVLHSYTLKAYAHGGIISDGSVNHPYSFNLLFFSMSLLFPHHCVFILFHHLTVSTVHSLPSLYLFIDELWGFSCVPVSQYGIRPFPSN